MALDASAVKPIAVVVLVGGAGACQHTTDNDPSMRVYYLHDTNGQPNGHELPGSIGDAFEQP